MDTETRIALELAGGQIEPKDLRAVVGSFVTLLRRIEESLTKRKAKADWRLDDDQIEVGFLAAANGVPSETLGEVASIARAGFEAVRNQNGRIEWPAHIDEISKRAINQIVRQLEQLDSITVRVEEQPPLLIDRAMLRETVEGRKTTYLEHGTVDGKLDLISVRGKAHFTIEDHATGRYVRCAIADSVFKLAKELLGHRVIVEGLVKTDLEGNPISVADILTLCEVPEPTKKLTDLVGSMPNLTGGVPSGEYIRRLRDRNGDDGN